MTTSPDDDRDAASIEWGRRCLERMLQLDPDADRALLEPIVRDMSVSERWRKRPPEEAAEWCFR